MMWRRLVYWQATFGTARMLVTNYTAQPSTTPGTLDNTIATMSNAVIVQIAEGPVTVIPPVPPPTGFVYASITQIARLTCLDSLGLEFTIGIPAPLGQGGSSGTGIFKADLVTVAPSFLASVLTAASLDGVLSPQGNPIASIVSGILNGPARPGAQTF